MYNKCETRYIWQSGFSRQIYIKSKTTTKHVPGRHVCTHSMYVFCNVNRLRIYIMYSSEIPPQASFWGFVIFDSNGVSIKNNIFIGSGLVLPSWIKSFFTILILVMESKLLQSRAKSVSVCVGREERNEAIDLSDISVLWKNSISTIFSFHLWRFVSISNRIILRLQLSINHTRMQSYIMWLMKIQCNIIYHVCYHSTMHLQFVFVFISTQKSIEIFAFGSYSIIEKYHSTHLYFFYYI